MAVRVWIVLLPLEVAAAILSYWTLGWTIPGILIGGTLLFNFVAFVVFAFRAWPGLALAFSYGLIIVGYQAELGIRWHYVHAEAERIVQWVDAEEKNSGRLPEDLSGYVFKHPANQNYVSYAKWNGNNGGVNWQVNYTVGTESTYYSYSPESGWYYHDD
jgi:hypothetical protein